MSLVKKIDVDKHLAARRATRIERTFKTKSAAAFIQEVAPVPVAADSGGTEASAVSQSRQA